ncbi:alpha/beta hydrolase [Pacificoceanicola onchidii]|uniref:alpha/beta hydrolase n=1 Tax=Pacificoceanicola onchidii TaxID=2562685 RepID=UPI0014562055|nr:alpha/beta fold hydrolase [Pacificoceanicola onchidii]
MIAPWTMKRLLRADPAVEFSNTRNLLADEPEVEIGLENTANHTTSHSIVGGIERFHAQPRKRNSHPPLLMVHGMWHNASCWKNWQAWLADHGWESVAFSLPGHGRSPVQRPVATCSLAYYLKFLVGEVERLGAAPVLVGHRMGGALVQWYLKHVGQPVAAVFVASWTSHDVLRDCLRSALLIDPLGTLLGAVLGWKFQFRSDRQVRDWFFSKAAQDEVTQLRSELGPESEIVLMQHRPPLWTPPPSVGCQTLWLSAGSDAIIPLSASRRSAQHYGSTFVRVADAGHDIMLDREWDAAANTAHCFLENMIGNEPNGSSQTKCGRSRISEDFSRLRPGQPL